MLIFQRVSDIRTTVCIVLSRYHLQILDSTGVSDTITDSICCMDCSDKTTEIGDPIGIISFCW